jgi:hypothetical protein
MIYGQGEIEGMERAKASGKYVIMATQGGGGGQVHECDDLAGALRYCEEHKGGASFAVILPNGEWHKWTKSK